MHVNITSDGWAEGLRDRDSTEQETVGGRVYDVVRIARQWLSVETLYAHALEAWCVAFTPNGKDILSGGDDAIVRGYSPFGSGANPATAMAPNLYDANDPRTESFHWKCAKLHDAGVTAVLPITPALYLTGSYDEYIRLLHVPELGWEGRKAVLAEERLGGGVWRLKLLDTPVPRWEEQYDILASCMHAGVRIVRLKRGREGKWRFEVLARFEKHESMNYGSDFQPGWGAPGAGRDAKPNERTIVSTSYYDRLVCAWKVTVP